MDDRIYKEIRTIINKFIKKDYWNSFCSADIFYFTDSKKKKSMITFIDAFFGESYGIQLFINYDGFNYVHDILTSKNPDMISIGDCDSICAILVSKEKLTEEDKKFLVLNRVRIKEENNLIIYRFQKGFAQRIVNDKELKMVFERLNYLDSIIDNEYNDVKSAFEKGLSVVSYVDLANYLYSLSYIPLPFLEHNPKAKPVNENFVLEHKEETFINDECYLFTSYLPIIIKENGVRPLLVYFYFSESNRSYLKFIIDEPKKYFDYIFGILDDVFQNIGKPLKIIFNNRDFYYYSLKTLNELQIECKRSDGFDYVDDNISSVISQVFEKTNDDVIEKESAVLLLMETLTNVLNELDSEVVKDNDDDTKLVS